MRRHRRYGDPRRRVGQPETFASRCASTGCVKFRCPWKLLRAHVELLLTSERPAPRFGVNSSGFAVQHVSPKITAFRHYDTDVLRAARCSLRASGCTREALLAANARR